MKFGKISTMEFLEDLEHYNQSMENAYSLITNEKTLEDIYKDIDNVNLENLLK